MIPDYIKSVRSKIGHDPLRSVSITCIIENELGEVLLQHRSDTLDYGTPGGNLELKENILEGLKREIREETHIELKNPKLFGLYSGESQLTKYPNGDETYYVVVVFYEQIMGKISIEKDHESLNIKFYDWSKLPHPLKPTDQAWLKDYQDNKNKLYIR